MVNLKKMSFLVLYRKKAFIVVINYYYFELCLKMTTNKCHFETKKQSGNGYFFSFSCV